MEAIDMHKKLRDYYKIDIKTFKIIKLIKKGGFGSVSSVSRQQRTNKCCQSYKLFRIR